MQRQTYRWYILVPQFPQNRTYYLQETAQRIQCRLSTTTCVNHGNNFDHLFNHLFVNAIELLLVKHMLREKGHYSFRRLDVHIKIIIHNHIMHLTQGFIQIGSRLKVIFIILYIYKKLKTFFYKKKCTEYFFLSKLIIILVGVYYLHKNRLLRTLRFSYLV